jgi:hypothetical protein
MVLLDADGSEEGGIDNEQISFYGFHAVVRH